MKYKLSLAVALIGVCSKFLTKLLQHYIEAFDRSITSPSCHHDNSSFPLQRHCFGFRWLGCHFKPDLGHHLGIEFLLSLRWVYPGDTPCPCTTVIFGILMSPSAKVIEVVTQHFNPATVIGHTGFCAMDKKRQADCYQGPDVVWCHWCICNGRSIETRYSQIAGIFHGYTELLEEF